VADATFCHAWIGRQEGTQETIEYFESQIIIYAVKNLQVALQPISGVMP
jgi:hypothetical protein